MTRRLILAAALAATLSAGATTVLATDPAACEWFQNDASVIENATARGVDFSEYVTDPSGEWLVGPPGCVALSEYLEAAGVSSAGAEDSEGLPLPDTAMTRP